jgi:transcription-repair coupling factor (superfamily II helicase)
VATPKGQAGRSELEEPSALPSEQIGLAELIDSLLTQSGARISGLKGTARAYVLAQLHRARRGVSVVLLPEGTALDAFQKELQFFLSEAGSAAKVLVFPPWQVLPYDDVPPHPETVGERLQTLLALQSLTEAVVVTTWDAIFQRTTHPDRLVEASITLRKDDEAPPEKLVKRLLAAGYTVATQVEDPGEYVVRGGILDVFPVGAEGPYRIDYFGDTVDSIRRFDPSSQVSLRALDAGESVTIPPAREAFILAGEQPTVEAALRDMAADVELARLSLDALTESLRTRGSFPFQDFVLPLLVPAGWFTEHIPAQAAFWILDQDKGLDVVEDALREANVRYKQLLDNEKLVAKPQSYYLDRDALLKKIGAYHHARVEALRLLGDAGTLETRENDDIASEVRSAGGLTPLAKKFTQWTGQGIKLQLTARTRGGLDRLWELLEPYNLKLRREPDAEPGTIYLRQAPLSRGFRIPREQIAVVTEEDIFGVRKRHAPPATRLKKEKFVAALRELKEGDFIVHVKHGVGKYLGLHTREVAGEKGDFFLVEYLGGDRLYIPVYKLEGVQKYVGSEGTQPRLDKLGGQTWEKTKRKVKEAVLAMAAELLELYASREIVEGFAFKPPGHLYEEFENSFEYEETPDQMQAINETLADMQRPRPMDRLVCGDVGYGKTEVAMRAAFKAVEDGKQVAVLVPTTVLAFQHLQTFRERVEAFPAKVAMLSRFVTPAEQKEVLVKVRRGEIDILIGTHRILQGDVDFKDLGLLVIDEEHRFGVKHKEKIKQLKKAVDVLTLTATPIPRTLHLSILGVRDLSIIATPPRDRLAIRTFVTPFDEATIAEALRRELRRQGQIFFIHNRIDSIHAMGEEIKRIVPEIRLEVAHGQMKEGELEKIMMRFLKHEFDMLLCTTIVESGIDIPTANTMVINRADRFGLAELYQLRGRVGRSNQRAYAYLIIDSEAGLTSEARQRLDVIQSFAELGSGFKVAAHDLEIRGAGEILGKNQSGQIAAVGFDLYTELIEQAVHELRGEPIAERPEPDLNLRFPAYLPESFMPDISQRLDFYQRLSRLVNEDDADHLMAEMTDRYGDLPPEAENLVEVSRVKVLLRELFVRSLDMTPDKAVIRLDPATPLSPEKLVALIAAKPDRLRLTGSDKLAFSLEGRTPIEALRFFLSSLRELSRFARI